MSFILNDASLEGYFQSVDDFEDSLHEKTIPLLNKIIDFSLEVHKSSKIYNRIVSEEKSLHDIIAQTTSPSISKFKKLLIDTCFDEPYFESDPKSDMTNSYFLGKDDTGEVPNCFSEAFESDMGVISFENSQFLSDNISVKKGKHGAIKSIKNFKDLEGSKDFFINNFKISLAEYLSFQKCSKKHIFYKKEDENSYATDNEYDAGKLSTDDIKLIAKKLKSFHEFVKLGTVPSHYTDSITHKGKIYYEFRCNITNIREFRIYYITNGKKHIYLNSYVKDQEKPPTKVKDKTVSLIKEYNKA